MILIWEFRFPFGSEIWGNIRRAVLSCLRWNIQFHRLFGEVDNSHKFLILAIVSPLQLVHSPKSTDSQRSIITRFAKHLQNFFLKNIYIQLSMQFLKPWIFINLTKCFNELYRYWSLVGHQLLSWSDNDYNFENISPPIDKSGNFTI